MKTRIASTVIGFTIGLFCLWPAAASAQTDTDKTLSPYLLIVGQDAALDRFPLNSTRVRANISGVIADVTVVQQYTNAGRRPVHARYIFPASTRAAVHGMQMTVGEKVITARIKERRQARHEFDQAKAAGRCASLLEQQRPNVFSMNVANIMPGDSVDIELHYTELLVPVDGTYSFVYPSVVGPRYSAQSEAGAPETDLWVKNPYLPEGSAPASTFDIQVTLSTGMPLQQVVCRSHATEIAWQGNAAAKIKLSAGKASGADRDYILDYRLSGRQIASGLMLYEGREENFFLLMVQPPGTIAPADIPDREYIFVVDVSGSMNGFPLDTAKVLLRDLIGHLRPTDTFNAVLFAGGSRLMAPASLPATAQNIDRAVRLIEQERGGGGTELGRALEKALALPRDESRCKTVIIVTDGYISAERQVFQLIQENLNRTNLFAFGIGSAVNRYLIEGMARAGQGEPFIVTEPGQARQAARSLRDTVRAPVLTNISLTWEGLAPYAIEPPSIPDLFARRPVILFGKYRGKPSGSLRLRGSGGSGVYEQTIDLAQTEPRQTHTALPYLWARTRIGRLSDYNLDAANSENRAEITRLGLTYNLLTAHTAFVAIEEVARNPDGSAKAVHQPLPLPKGVSAMAVSVSCAKVPEPELIVLFSAVLLLAALRAGRRLFNGSSSGNDPIGQNDYPGARKPS